MSPLRSPSRLSLALLLAACGDSGGATAGATTTLTSAVTTDDATSAPGTAQSSGEPTTVADATTAAPSTTTDATTAAPGTTTGAPEATTTAATTSTTSGEFTTGATTTTTGDQTSGGGPVCGDLVVDPGETCDDGVGVGCDTYHDGGDGVCVPPGTCSPGHVLAGEDCVPELWVDHVHIHVDNTCKMKVEPTSFTVQPGQKLRLDYHNHSADYPVDVWMHYNGGFTDLPPGGTWMEKYEHCFGPNPSEGWAEISTACSQVVLPIKCL